MAFQQEAEMSVSPENTFVNGTDNHHLHSLNRGKRVSTANLLHENTPSASGNNSSDDASLGGKINNATHSRTDSDSDLEDDDDINGKPAVFSREASKHYRPGRYLLALHRKLTRQDVYFLSHQKTSVSLFGVPLLIPCHENGTNKDLYVAVWLQVNRLLSPLPPNSDQSSKPNHAADW